MSASVRSLVSQPPTLEEVFLRHYQQSDSATEQAQNRHHGEQPDRHRHTRTEEEAGRRKLTGATAVGRHAGLAAAVIAGVLRKRSRRSARRARHDLPGPSPVRLVGARGRVRCRRLRVRRDRRYRRAGHLECGGGGSPSADSSWRSCSAPSVTPATGPAGQRDGSPGCRRSGGRIGCVPSPVNGGGSSSSRWWLPRSSQQRPRSCRGDVTWERVCCRRASDPTPPRRRRAHRWHWPGGCTAAAHRLDGLRRAHRADHGRGGTEHQPDAPGKQES